jgi:IS1 family transposase
MEYVYKAYQPGVDAMITKLLCESVGIRGIGRILRLSINTVLSRIKRIAAAIKKPAIGPHLCALEMDEMSVFIGNRRNKCWIIYLLERSTGKVVDFVVGNRSKETIQSLLGFLSQTQPPAIYTDYFPSYRSAIPAHLHIPGRAVTNHIERMNLNLRTHIKRLGRRTICYSKSTEMLEACLRVYFWENDHSY